MARDIDVIKQKLDLVDVIKSYVSLSPAGKNLKGLCPFHQETKPSFIVSPDRQIWHCFGCGEGGDIFKFIMLYENFNFPEALSFLAEKAGVEIEKISRGDRRQFDVLYEINEEAKRFFVEELKKNKEALDYLRKRGLKSSTIEDFELGFAPYGDFLVRHFLAEGFKIDEIERAGLVFKNKRGLYQNRFAGRIVFPIVNEIEKTVAFTGRILKESENSPKYLNSPESPVFDKSKVLYGLYKSKSDIVAKRAVFLVEGQMDFLMSWQSGIKNVVAVSGTGLTSKHLTKLKRIADTILLSFDNDEGGLRALERSLDLFSEFDFYVKVVDLGKYGDPADACLDDTDFLHKSIESAKPAFVYLFDYYFKDYEKAEVAKKKKIIRHLLDKISRLKSLVEQDIWINKLAEYSGIGEAVLRGEMEGFLVKGREKTEGEGKIINNPQERIDVIARRLILLAFANSDFMPLIKENWDYLPSNYRQIVENRNDEQIAFLELESTYEMGKLTPDALKKEVADLVRHLKIEYLKKKQAEIKEKMRAIEDGNEKELSFLIDKFHETARQIEELKRV